MESLEDRRLFTVLAPGGAVPLFGTTSAARPELAGVVVRDALIPFTVLNGGGGTVFKGQLQDRVVKENATGTLDFYQRIIADPGFTPLSSVDFVSRALFAGWGTDVDYRVDGVGAPTIKPERASRSGDGVSVRFDFNSDVITGGQSSRFYFVRTNAKFFNVRGDTAIGMGVQTLGFGSVKLTTAQPVKGGVISGYKFHDRNANGTWDKGEAPLSKWNVYIDADKDGVRDAGEPSTFTNGNGYYQFSNLPQGTYTVREVQQPGWRQTAPAGGAHVVTVGPGGVAANRNFGNTRLARISGTVFYDTDKDGKRDRGEAPLSGWTVYLDLNNDKVRQATEPTRTTNKAGGYAFDFGGGAVYHVRVVRPLGYVQTLPAANGSWNLFASAGGTYAGRDFGLYRLPIVIK